MENFLYKGFDGKKGDPLKRGGMSHLFSKNGKNHSMKIKSHS